MSKRDGDIEDAGKLIGYARVSTSDQRVEMQTNALLRAGVAPGNLYSESASGVKKGRPVPETRSWCGSWTASRARC